MVRTREEDMAQSEQLIIGDRLTLVFADSDRKLTVSAKVREIHDSHLLIVLLAGTSALEPDANVIATYAREDTAYTFESRVIDLGDVPAECAAITLPQRIERWQRRRYFRIPVDGSATVTSCNVTLGANSAVELGRVSSAQCLNASGNGFLIGCDSSFELGQHLLLHLDLPAKGHSVDTIGRVARIGAPDGRRFKYGIGIFTNDELREKFSNEILVQLPPQFRLFGEKQRATLINQLFARQAELRQTGML
jgi:Tfp pilus assembly protein PilZ